MPENPDSKLFFASHLLWVSRQSFFFFCRYVDFFPYLESYYKHWKFYMNSITFCIHATCNFYSSNASVTITKYLKWLTYEEGGLILAKDFEMFLRMLCSGCRTPASPVYRGRDTRQRKLVRALNTGMGRQTRGSCRTQHSSSFNHPRKE